ncbi:right-handed parallel beta-helix repeat-containing protein [Olivibacter sp. CPCC 100613]|uniref:right-handed parallel beta-helix repeat-containing protein n=1 Tax=Olivibacter sp. CPCC 100613 TaxID=3079931 RepID=UPI002FFC54FB
MSCQTTTKSNSTGKGKPRDTTVYQVLDVQVFHAKGDGKTDDTKSIQQAIQAAQKGDTVLIPSGTYLVKTLILKSDINIKGLGQLKQVLPTDTQKFSRVVQNSSAPLFFGRNLRNINLHFRASTQNEALYISKSSNIRIVNTNVQGNDKKIYAFPGMLFYECDTVSIKNSHISAYGAGRQSASKYQAGTGIRLLSCSNIYIANNQIIKNGENGIFMHGSGRAIIKNNHIAYNGMSAIQIGFGKTKREQYFDISNNTLNHNAADAIDINNKITPNPFPIHCIIKNNKSFNNGFVAGESTVDGSGLATLVNVSETRVLNNTSKKSNRPALYLERCGVIRAENNITDNKVEIVQAFDKILLKNNTFDALTILSKAKGVTLQLMENKFRTILLPNDIAIDSLILIKNVLANTSLNINLRGRVIMNGNEIFSNQPTGAILLVKTQGASLVSNRIKSTSGYAVTVRKSAEAVRLERNTIQSVNACVIDEGSKNLTLQYNKLISIPGGKLNRTLISHNPYELILKSNVHKGGKTDNSIRLEGTGSAYIADEKTVSGYPDYGKVVVKKL